MIWNHAVKDHPTLFFPKTSSQLRSRSITLETTQIIAQNALTPAAALIAASRASPTPIKQIKRSGRPKDSPRLCNVCNWFLADKQIPKVHSTAAKGCPIADQKDLHLAKPKDDLPLDERSNEVERRKRRKLENTA